MKVICNTKAYWDGEIIKPGQVLNIKGDTVPTWATAFKSKKTQNDEKENTPEENVNNEQNQNVQNEGENTPEENPVTNQGAEKVKVNPMDALELSRKSESELSVILDELLTKALDKGIEIDLEKQSTIESIIELRTKLKEVKE